MMRLLPVIGALVLLGTACGSSNNGAGSSTNSGSSNPASTSAAVATNVIQSQPPAACPTALADIPATIPNVPPAPAGAQIQSTPSGLRYIDLKAGTGATPKPGQTVTVNYTGWLLNGTKFDASADHGQAFSFAFGQGQVIKGWDEGLSTMKVGGQRRLIIPPDLGYGTRGAGGAIPPCATLIFDVELLAAQ
jgi:peptidylprolyl isomerase